MKPGDHPEFFRLPPPPGASRESTIVLDVNGRFFHDGEPVEKKSLADALHRWITSHPDDGKFILTNGYDWTYFTVEDTPCFVTGLKGAPPAPPILVLADGNEEPLDPSTLRVDESGVCFASVRDGRFEARFLRHAQTDLAPWLSDSEPLALRVGEAVLSIGPRDRRQ